jgi:hypothetical protein
LGVPAFVLYPAQPIYFIQTPTEVLMTWQADHMLRRVFLTDKHSANPKPSWFGESIAHYEGGDTLVVTPSVNTRTSSSTTYRTPPPTSCTVERFKLAPDAKSIEVTMTVEDPAPSPPWSASAYRGSSRARWSRRPRRRQFQSIAAPGRQPDF